MTENLFQPNSIRTFTGKYLDFTNIREVDICIEDIAHALSLMPRWAGHTKGLLSVGFHSICCCRMASDTHKLGALLHDASEAYLCDLPKPIKDLLPEYKVYEDNLMRVIARKFGFQYPLNHEVKHVDNKMLEREWRIYVLSDKDWYEHNLPTPQEIEIDFLIYFYSLWKGKRGFSINDLLKRYK